MPSDDNTPDARYESPHTGTIFELRLALRAHRAATRALLAVVATGVRIYDAPYFAELERAQRLSDGLLGDE